MISRAVSTFVKDPMLSRIECVDSLKNLCLFKIYELHSRFEYQQELSEEHNQRRFLALVKKSLMNLLIEHHYLANLPKRKPARGLVSTAAMTYEDDDGGDFEVVHSHQATPFEIAQAEEINGLVKGRLCEDGLTVLLHLQQGFVAEDISRKTGILISRVRYLIYSRIKPLVKEYCVIA